MTGVGSWRDDRLKKTPGRRSKKKTPGGRSKKILYKIYVANSLSTQLDIYLSIKTHPILRGDTWYGSVLWWSEETLRELWKWRRGRREEAWTEWRDEERRHLSIFDLSLPHPEVFVWLFPTKLQQGILRTEKGKIRMLINPTVQKR